MASLAKREDKLPLERALRALEDLHKSLKEFATVDSVARNPDLKAEAENVRAKTKKLRKRTQALAAIWDRTFKEKA
jgi:two-component sensor histidine kinase